MECTLYIKGLSYYKYLTHNRYRKYITREGREYKDKLETEFKRCMADKPIISTTCIVDIVFYFNTKYAHDLDNYAKPILDCMNDIVFNDDRQVVDLRVRKFYKEVNLIMIKVIP